MVVYAVVGLGLLYFYLMAENKASFILYSDLIHTVSKLPDEVAGKLLKHILEYVNDKDPQTDDILLQVAFEPIKLQLKRDLRSWEKTLEEKSEGGKLGNLKRWHPDLYNQVTANQMSIGEALLVASNRKESHTDTDQSHPIASVAVNVNDTVTDTVNVKKNTLEDRKLKFADTLKPFLSKFSKDMLNDFYRYWTEPNKSGTKFRQELEKAWDLQRRLDTWAKRDNTFNKQDIPVSQTPKKEFKG